MDEILVNAKTSPNPPAIAGNSGSDFVVVWNDLGSVDLKGQIFQTDGQESGDEFLINTTREGPHTLPAVTNLAGLQPGFGVAWIADELPSAPVTKVLLQRFTPDGTKRDGEILVNTTEVERNRRPAIARLPDATFVVSWVAMGERSVRAQVFDEVGTKSGPEIQVNSSEGVHTGPVVAAPLQNNSFAIAWQGGPNFGSTTARLQIFQPTGDKVGPEKIPDIQVRRGMAMSFIDPGGLGERAGDFVIAHISLVSGDEQFGERIVIATVFGPDGEEAPLPSLGEFNLTHRGDLSIARQPAVAALPNQRFVVAWTDRKVPEVGDTTEDNIMAMFCTVEGPQGEPFPVHTTLRGNQTSPCVTTVLDELGVTVALAWVDDSVSGSDVNFRAVKARVL